MVRVEYACLDGSPFPVTFAEPDDVGLAWTIDREHAPTAMTPLADAVGRVGSGGSELAYAESGLAPPSMLSRQRPHANGYSYHVDGWLPEAEREDFEQGLRRLADRHGGTLGVWLNHSLPRVRDACSWLSAAPLDTTFAALTQQRAYAWSHTAIAGVIAQDDLRAVAASCEPVFGDGATLVAYRLAQGSQNETISADVALGQIARMEPGSPEAVAASARFLAVYGSRATSWPIDAPTFVERPDLLEHQLRMLRRSPRDFDTVGADATHRRRRLVEEISARLGGDEERARFERRLDRLTSFVPVREARAHWQLVASGALRHAVQAKGRRLVEQGVLDTTDDVFFLTSEEYDDPAGDLRARVAVRRADHAVWMAVTPPVVVGATTQATTPASDGLVRGTAGAPGVVSGTARVILDLVDAERFEQGDVLVTTMTSPSWTPMLGIAAAVVTDAGDPLSHVAIAAREYGIPCVVGTDYATLLIRDGASVTVDGGAGTVRVNAQRQP